MLDVAKIMSANSMQVFFFFFFLILETSVPLFEKLLGTSLIMGSENLTEFKLYR
jgi:hypothetical protein